MFRCFVLFCVCVGFCSSAEAQLLRKFVCNGNCNLKTYSVAKTEVEVNKEVKSQNVINEIAIPTSEVSVEQNVKVKRHTVGHQYRKFQPIRNAIRNFRSGVRIRSRVRVVS